MRMGRGGVILSGMIPRKRRKSRNVIEKKFQESSSGRGTFGGSHLKGKGGKESRKCYYGGMCEKKEE